MARTSEAVFPVIMAGGSGTRFWPLSRSARPKQFLPLATSSPLIVDTMKRLKGVAPPSRTLVVCGKAHAAAVKRLLKLPAANILVEPVARNTAPAIALAAAHVHARDPEGILVVLPSDQHVADLGRFREALSAAVHAAQGGSIVTIGIKPSRPETGYGYIQLGEVAEVPAHRVAAFVEKPDQATAERYVADPSYLWNAGIFVFRADVMLEAFDVLMPELARLLLKLRDAIGTRRYARALSTLFPRMPSISIDYGVAERAENILVVPGDFGWSDVGSFAALPDVRQADAHGNVVSGGEGAIVLDSSGCVVLGSGRPVAVVGMTDVAVVDAGDAVLVLPKARSQDVRKVVDELKKRKKLAHFL